MEPKTIVANDGTRIKVPIKEEMTYALSEDGVGYAAVRATPIQVEDYYRAACMSDVNVLWSSGETYYNDTYLLDTGTTRYDMNYRVDPLDQVNKDIPSQIHYIRERYEKDDPLVRGIVDVMAELTAGKLVLEGGDEDIQKMYAKWNRQIGMQDLIENIAHQYWLSGNVIMNLAFSPVTKRANIPFQKVDPSGLIPPTEQDVIEALASRLDSELLAEVEKQLQATAAPKKNWTKKKIPMDYAVLDPILLEPKGYPKKPDYYMKPDDATRLSIRNAPRDGEEWETLIAQFGKQYVEDIKNNKSKGQMEAERIRTVFAKKAHYNHWGYVPGGAATMYMQLKRRLSDLGLNTISQALSFIVLIRIGTDEFPAKEEQLVAISKVWKERSRKNPSAALFQPHTTQIDIISPPAESMELLHAQIYDNPNMQIAQSWGVNLALITGISNSTMSYSLASMAIRPMIRRIVTAHGKIEEFIYNEYLAIGTTMGYEEEDIPYPRFIGTGLENAAEVGAAFQAALDRGMPYKYYLEALGIHFDAAVEQAKVEQDMELETLFPMRGSPTQKPGVPPDDTGKAPGTPQIEEPTEDFPEQDTSKSATAGEVDINKIYQEMKKE